jgi:DNA primase
MCFKRLGISGIEVIAPDSENITIPESFMKPLLQKYQKVVVLFDNDEPGMKSAAKYKSKYGFKSINLPLSKDLSDSVKDYGADRVREELFPLLKEAL